jgi:copper chaperone
MQRFHLPDMSCGHCVAAITEALKAADPEARIDIDRDARTATVDTALPREALAATLTEAGYPPAPSDTPV